MGTRPPQRAIIITGGDVPHRGVLSHVNDDHVLIAADSGWDGARALALVPHMVIGDLDSISGDGLADARALGVTVVEHPADKDFTDAELALETAVRTGTTHVTLIGGGDRFDHVVGLLHLLVHPEHAHLRMDAFVGTSRITRASSTSEVSLTVQPGTTVSLLAVGGDAHGVTTTGLRWTLDGETLATHVSRGVSNRAVAETVTCSVDQGMVLIIEPEYFDTGEEQ